MNKVYYNFSNTPYYYEYNRYTFYFSSEFNRDRFAERVESYVADQKLKLQSKYHCSVYATSVIMLDLYRKIEKRGFRITKPLGLDIKENYSISITVD